MKKKYSIKINVANESIKFIYFEPNAFEYKVKKGDKLEVEVSESQIKENIFDKSTPFQIDIDQDAITVWLNVIPEQAFINGEPVGKNTH